MGLEVGIVGLPNVGKSTLFNLLMKRAISPTANYPFTTIKPHTGVVTVADSKFDQLVDLIKPDKYTPATVTFVDIAGLVKNAHKGEGLGNEFLGQIRNVDAIIHLLRGFEDNLVAHVMGKIDPDRDRDIVDIELELGKIKKPTLYVLNSDKKSDDWSSFDLSKSEIDLTPLINQTYQLLKLITFYIIKGGKEVRATPLPSGSTAIDAAERIHTDFAKNFINAQVININDLLEIGSWQEAKKKGKVRTEGKDYIVNNEDIIEFMVSS